MTASVKTAISVQEELFEAINRLAEELHVSRSKLFVMAMEEFIEKNKNRKLLAQINMAQADPAEADELLMQAQLKKRQASIIGADAW